MFTLSASVRCGLLAVTLVACDYYFLVGTSDGRMDAMCFALGLTGIASHQYLRHISLARSLFVSQVFIASSLLTHPNGTLWFVSSMVLIFWQDRDRLDVRLLAWLIAPYLIGLSFWGLFVWQDPHEFLVQMAGNIRESGSSNNYVRHPLLKPFRP